MATILEAKAIISGEDRTGPAFASAERKLGQFERSARGVEKVSAAMSKLSNIVASRRMIDGLSNFEEKLASNRLIDGMSRSAAAIDKVGDAVVRAETRVSRLNETFGRVVNSAHGAWTRIAPFAEGAIGAGALRATGLALKAGADLESQRARMTVAGVGSGEIKSAEDQSFALAARYPNLSPAELMQTYLETRSVVTDPTDTPHLMPTVAAARSALKILGKDEGGGHESLVLMAKAAETMGITQDPERFRRYMDAVVRANEVMQGTIKPETVQAFSQQMKSAATVFSDRFIATTGMSMIQDMGPRGGAGLSDWVKLMSGHITGKEAAEWKNLGLLKDDDVLTNKVGTVVGLKPGRHIEGYEQAISDPDLFVWNRLMPALQAKGFDDPIKRIAEVYSLVGGQRGSDAIGKLIEMEPNFKGHAQRYAEAQGVEGASTLLKNDPTASLAALTTQLQSFGAVLTSPVMVDAAHTLSSMATTMGGWSKSLHDFESAHPELSKVLGGGAIAGGGVLGVAGISGFISAVGSGFGLKASAVALGEAAGQLDAAAARLGTAGALQAKMPAAPKFGGGPSANDGLGFRTGIAIIDVASAVLNAPGIKQDDKGTYIEEPDWVKQFNDWYRKSAPPWMQPGAASDAIGEWFHHSATETWPPGHVAPLGHAPPNVPEHQDIKATIDGPVTAQLTGAADINVHVEVTADKDAIVKSVVSKVSSSGPLRVNNTGKSMPEAAPNRTGRQ